MKADENWWLNSATYLSNISVSFDQEERDELVAFLNEALQFAKENCKGKSLKVFNDLVGDFTRDGCYIFACNYDGRTLAFPYQPDLIGASRIDVQDPNGVYFVQKAIDTAKEGNGFHCYIYADLSRNMTLAPKLSYIANVDNTWFLGSGIYSNGEEASGL
jgi:signal transduction histidine kinase